VNNLCLFLLWLGALLLDANTPLLTAADARRGVVEATGEWGAWRWEVFGLGGLVDLVGSGVGWLGGEVAGECADAAADGWLAALGRCLRHGPQSCFRHHETPLFSKVGLIPLKVGCAVAPLRSSHVHARQCWLY
jgi:hypothetical protein